MRDIKQNYRYLFKHKADNNWSAKKHNQLQPSETTMKPPKTTETIHKKDAPFLNHLVIAIIHSKSYPHIRKEKITFLVQVTMSKFQVVAVQTWWFHCGIR